MRNLGVCVLGFGLLTFSSPAAVLTVHSLADDGRGSLREAIRQANTSRGQDHIVLIRKGTILLESPLPEITGKATISGPGKGRLTIDGQRSQDMLCIGESARVTLSGLAFANAQTAIRNAGQLEIWECSIKDCSGAGDGAGIRNEGNLVMGRSVIENCVGDWVWDPFGGGIANFGVLRMEESRVKGCRALRGGGIYSEGTLIVHRSTIEGCEVFVDGLGGGVCSGGEASITRSLLSNCLSYIGGGMFSSGKLLLQDSVIEKCYGEYGGGAHLNGNNVVENCTFTENQAGYGGGLTLGEGFTDVLNSTITDNTSSFGASAIALGDFWSGPDRQAFLNHCTIYGNLSPTASAAVQVDGVLYAANTIFAGNPYADLDGNLNSLGHNLVQTPGGSTILNEAPTDLLSLDPMLGPLQLNGGCTPTHALLPNSPCIDAGSREGLNKDQCGKPRHNYQFIPDATDGSDIGAFELKDPKLRKNHQAGRK